MKIGIIGKPQCGKTTIFNAAAGQEAAVGDFSQAVHRAVIKVPDERVDELAKIANPRKITYAEIEFLDAPGFTGQGKESAPSEINPELKLMEALAVVIDDFSGTTDPAGDIQNLLDEMILADQILVENNIEKKSRKIKLSGDKSGAHELDLLDRCQKQLEQEKRLIDLDFTEEDDKMLRGYMFLTRKPVLLVINIAEEKLPQTDEIYEQFRSFIIPGKQDLIVMCGKIQMELASMSPEEQKMFLEEYGITSLAVDRFIQKSYELLGLISFLTLGEPEVRAWTIARGTPAQKAAGAIHSDIERGFIRAEVVRYEDYIKYKTLPEARSAGKMHLEGKEYVVQDGDVILFRFNV